MPPKRVPDKVFDFEFVFYLFSLIFDVCFHKTVIKLYIPPNVLTGCPGLLGTGRGAEPILAPKALPGPPSEALQGFWGVLGTLVPACQSLQGALGVPFEHLGGSFSPKKDDLEPLLSENQAPKCVQDEQSYKKGILENH